jgi:hypothetical protein
MSLPLLGSYVFGGRVFIYPEGDVVTIAGLGGTGAASATRKPGALDPLWIDVGNVVDADEDLDPGSPIERWGHVPGHLALLDEIDVKPKQTFKFGTDEVGPYHMELLYRSLRLNSSSTQFNPLESIIKRAWVKRQFYDAADVLRLTVDTWCKVKLTGGLKMSGGELAKPNFECLTLHSIYNTATL